MEGPGYRPCQDVPGRAEGSPGEKQELALGGWAGGLDAHVRQ